MYSKNNTYTAIAVGITVLSVISAVLQTNAQAASSQQAGPLEHVVVVATKRERQIKDIAAEISVLTQKDIHAVMSNEMGALFRYLPGIDSVGGGTRFNNEGVSIRGIGGNRVVLELDGAPISEHFSIGNFASSGRDFVDTGLLQQLEVLRGPASIMYGSKALGGVVSMHTLDPRQVLAGRELGGTLGGGYQGFDDSKHLSSSLALGGQRAAVLLAGSHRQGTQADSNAIRNHTLDSAEYERNYGLLKAVVADAYDNEWTITAMQQYSSRQSDLRAMLGTGRFRSTSELQGDDRYDMSRVVATLIRPLDALHIDEMQLTAFHTQSTVTQSTQDVRAFAARPVEIARQFDYQQTGNGVELNLHSSFSTGGWDHRWSLGLEYNRQEVDELRDAKQTSLLDGSVSNTVLGETFPLRDFPVSTTTEQGIYLAHEAEFGPLVLLSGIRYDASDLAVSVDSIYLEDNPATTPVEVSEADLSPRVGMIWRLNEKADAYLQYTHGFRAPPFADANIGLDIPLFNVRAIPNPDLKSERSRSLELGFRWLDARASAQLGLFSTQYKDFIDSKSRLGIDSLTGRLLFQSVNIDRARIHGVEARWNQHLTGALEGLEIHASAYWADGRNKATDQALNSVGPAQAVIGVRWQSPDQRWRAEILNTVTRPWRRRDESGGELFKPAGYGVLDLFIEHRLSRVLSAQVGIQNFTDKTYWQWNAVSGLSADDPLIPQLSSPGRNISLSFEWSL